MKLAWFFLAAIVVFALFVVPGCETDQAVTGIRVQNNIGGDITEVRIVLASSSFDGAPNLLSSNIPDGDYRDFETIAGDYDVLVSVPTFDFQDVYSVTVIDGQVTTVIVEVLPE